MIIPVFSAALPEILLGLMSAVILLTDVFLKERFRITTYLLVQAALIGAFVCVFMQYHADMQPLVTFDGQYVLDRLGLLTKGFVLIASFFAFIYAKPYLETHDISRSEYYILGLFAVMGMLVMASAHTFLTIYLGLELLSIALYAMVALHKKISVATEAAIKYFVTGALASGILLYGISLIYGVTGTVDLDAVNQALLSVAHGQSSAAIAALIFIIIGLLFKLGAVPFHMWVPDVYDGAPSPVTLFIASAPKMAAFCITLRILTGAFGSMNPIWTSLLTIVAMLSMFSGNVLAIAQTNIKRMLAYSSIAHMGYALLGIIAGSASANGYSAAFFYMVTYVLVAAGAFAVIGLLSSRGIELNKLEDYRGLNARHPWIAFIMLLLMFSMAGVPPTVGFFAKLGLLEALVEAHLIWLAAFALLFAIIGAYYYLRVVMLMYFEEPVADTKDAVLTAGPLIAITANGLMVLGLGLLPSALIDLCRIAV